ncbi:hypothetical protein M422DRAFT_29028 [Sphaerobolus stellatus SS14]|uniref:Uncharacterized protein n=1 Tax=Sphaerobolus stellatus (strain SS14) TaxID=990650 RepID=A0A0C9UHE9_SPHS4|nr:hypothetical protein M422DRAFT_31273 [Sphaerobolus stellatus SS14]KIJ47117.1 hypothetical protein M422DRAFT_29028 [Sphaerobolus stellatus SS14]
MPSTVTRVVIKVLRTRSSEKTPVAGVHRDTNRHTKKDLSGIEIAEMLDPEDMAW